MEPCPGACGDGVVGDCGFDAEECDDALGPRACPDGFSGGAAECIACRLDTRGCVDCLGSPSARSCGALEATGGAGDLGVAVGEEAAAVAWTLARADGDGVAAWALFDRDLARVAGPTCLDPEGPRADEVALAAVAGGFLLAASTTEGTAVYPLDPGGAPRGEGTLVPDLREIRLTAQRSGEAALLTGITRAGEIHGVLLDANARAPWRARLFEAGIQAHIGSAVHTGESFLVAMRASPGARIGVVTVTDDGAVTCDRTVAEESSEYPQIDWDGRRARITWADFSSFRGRAVLWAELDETGARIGEPAELEGAADLFNPAPLRAVGGRSLVLAGGYTGGVYTASHLELHRLDARGSAVAPPERLVDNPELLGLHRIERWGDELLVSWLRANPALHGRGAIGLAVVRP